MLPKLLNIGCLDRIKNAKIFSLKKLNLNCNKFGQKTLMEETRMKKKLLYWELILSILKMQIFFEAMGKTRGPLKGGKKTGTQKFLVCYWRGKQ